MDWPPFLRVYDWKAQATARTSELDLSHGLPSDDTFKTVQTDSFLFWILFIIVVPRPDSRQAGALLIRFRHASVFSARNADDNKPSRMDVVIPLTRSTKACARSIALCSISRASLNSSLSWPSMLHTDHNCSATELMNPAASRATSSLRCDNTKSSRNSALLSITTV